jgi:hypothetical protein
VLRGGDYVGRGGNDAIGLNTWADGTLEAHGVTAMGEGATRDRGIYVDGDDIVISQSVLEGDTHYAHVVGSTPVHISNSRLIGGLKDGTPTCVAVTMLDTFYQNSCP